MKSVFVLLAIALVAHAEPKQEIRAKRATSVIGYVNAAVGGCQALTGSVGSYCNLGYQTPSSIAIRYSATLGPLISQLNGNTLSASCKTSAKDVLCKSFFPKCSSDGTTAQYQTYTSSCNSISSCGTLSGILGNGISTTALCLASGTTRTINLKSCSKYTSNTINQATCGSLPSNISFPSSALSDISRDSVFLGTIQLTFSSLFGVSTSCRQQWEKFLCVAAPYCGSGSQTLSAVTKQDCESAVNCLPGTLKTTYSKIYVCTNYPDKSVTRACVDPSQGFQQLDKSVTTCNSASAITIGSTLFYLACALLAYFH